MDIFEKNDFGMSIGIDRITKTALNQSAGYIIHSAMEGHTDPLSEYIKAKALSELASYIADGLKDEAFREAEKYGSNQVVDGCTIAIKATPTTYDFSHDSEWSILNEKIEEMKARMKEREKKMIDAIKYSELIDESGEIIPAAVIKKHGGQTISVTIPK